MLTPSIWSAFATADFTSLASGLDEPFSVNWRMFRASSTCLPRMRSATSRTFRGAILRYRSTAFIALSLRRRRCGRSSRRHLLLLGGVAMEGPRRRELAQLVTDHLLGDEHRDELLAVMDGERMTDHVRRDHRSARPRLDDRLLSRIVHLPHPVFEVRVHERTLLQ